MKQGTGNFICLTQLFICTPHCVDEREPPSTLIMVHVFHYMEERVQALQTDFFMKIKRSTSKELDFHFGKERERVPFLHGPD